MNLFKFRPRDIFYFFKKIGMEKILSSIIFWGIALILFVPFIFDGGLYFPFITGKAFYVMALSEIVFFLWAVLAIFYPKYRPTKNSLTAAVAFYFLAYFLATIFGANFQHSFWGKFERMGGFVFLGHLFLFFLVMISFLKTRERWMKLVFITSFLGATIGLLNFVNKFFNVTIIAGDKSGLSFGNDSFLATYLLMALFFSLIIFLEKPKEKGKLFFLMNRNDYRFVGGLFTLATGLGLFSTGGRAAKISALFGIFLVYLFYLAFYERERTLNKVGKVILVIVLVAVAILIIDLLIPNSIAQNILSIYTTKARSAVWSASWEMFREKPLFGWGPENFEYGFIKHFNPKMFLPEYGGETRFDKAHNVVFDTLIDAGIFGLLAFILIYFLIFRTLWIGYKKRKISFNLAAVLSALFISHFLQNLTVFDTPGTYVLWIFALGFVGFLGGMEECLSDERQQQNFSFFKFVAVLSLLIITISSFYFFVIQPYRSCATTALAFKEEDSQKRVKLYEKTLTLSPISRYSIRESFALSSANLYGDNLIPRSEIEFVLGELEKTISENPYEVFSAYFYGKIVHETDLKNDFQKLVRAERYLEQAIGECPKLQYLYWDLAYIEADMKNFDKAVNFAEKAIDLEPKVEYSHIVALDIAKEKRDEKLFRNIMERYLYYFPEKKNEVLKILKEILDKEE